MKRQKEKILSAQKQRDLLMEKTKKQQEEQRKGMLVSFPFLELEDKKVAYQELDIELEGYLLQQN
jgi:hypothetical protein